MKYLLGIGLWLSAMFMPVVAEERLTLVYTVTNLAYSSMLNELVAQRRLPVDLVYVDNDDIKVTLLKAQQSDSLPDMLIMPNDHLGLAIPFREFLDDGWQQTIEPQYLPEDLRSARRGVPVIGGNQLVLYYNKRFVAKPMRDFTELDKVAASLPEGVATILWSVMEPFWFQPFYSIDRASFFNMGNPDIDRPEMWRGLANYRRLIDLAKVDIACDYSCAFNGFVQGKSAYTINGEWAMQEFSALLGDDLGVLRLPTFEGHVLHPYYGSRVFAMPAKRALSDKQENVVKSLLEGLLSDDFQMALWRKAKLMPVHNGVASALDDPVFSSLAGQVQEGNYMPQSAAMTVVWESLNVGLRRFLLGVFDEQEAAHFMQIMTNKTLSEQGRAKQNAG